MTGFKEKYINPFTDYGFKRLFGEEPNKDLLLDFLNELLKNEQGKITELTYLKNENLGRTELNRKAVFDLYCTNEEGEKFIVEHEDSLKYYRDIKNSLDTAKEEKAIEIAKNMIKKGMDISLISEMTGLTEKEINTMKE